MPVKIGIIKETAEGERRVAIDPSTILRLHKLGAELVLETGAGDKAHFPDSAYDNTQITKTAEEVFQRCDVILKVQGINAQEISWLNEQKTFVGFLNPYRETDRVKQLRDSGATTMAMELVPRITRAQAIDALSSQANLAGYKCAIIAANLASGFFPMLTTAAGTIRPAKVVVIGAGVAGLQAIATAKRLGAQVEAYDIRSAAKEQVESLGAKLIDTGVSAEGEGGYARELTAEEKQQQADVLAEHLAKANAVISTAAIPGRPAPRIISKHMVEQMQAGSVIVDMAAETGGNCELTQAGQTIIHNDITIDGPCNIASSAPRHASELYARNLLHLLELMIVEQSLKPNWEDEVLAGTCLTRGGQIIHAGVKNVIEGAP